MIRVLTIMVVVLSVTLVVTTTLDATKGISLLKQCRVELELNKNAGSR